MKTFSADHSSAPQRAPELRLLQPGEAHRWDAFVESCPEATFFHRAGWQRVIETAYGHRTWFYYAERGGEIVGVLPLAEVRSRLFGHVLCSLPFCVRGGVAASDDTARAMLDAAAEVLARERQVGYLESRCETARHDGAGAWQTRDVYATFRKAIADDDDANLHAIPRKQRAVIRHSMASGLRAETDSQVDRFFTLYAAGVHRLGTPVFPRRYFRLLKDVFGDACEIRTVVQHHQAVASLMSFYWRDEVLPYYFGGLPAARACGASDYAYWNLMQAAASRGCGIFDFGRSKLGTGAYDYKKNWGFVPTPLQYEYKLINAAALPDNNPLNPKYRRFIALWKKLPLPVANFLGPYLARSLG